jgi:RND family efflux transporter MFP subunit
MGALAGGLKLLKPWQIGVLVVVALAAFGVTYGVYALVKGSGGAGLSSDQQLIPVQRGNLVNQVSINGSLAFPERDTLTFGAQGTVAEILVEEGQRVEKDQALARLDQSTVASLEEAVAQARVRLRDAEDALAEAKAPHTALELAQAEANVASARLSLKSAQDALDALTKPTAQQMAQAEAAVSSARLSLKSAQEALDRARAGPDAEDLADAQAKVDSAEADLRAARADLKLVQGDWDAKLKTASDALDAALDGYKSVFSKWLGVELSEQEEGMSPDLLLDSWNADLAYLFDRNARVQELRARPEFTAIDDPDTRWNEVILFAWVNLFPGEYVVDCENTQLATGTMCASKEMDEAWDAYQAAMESFDTVQTQAAKALTNAENAVARSVTSRDAAQKALADLKAETESLEMENLEKQLALAQANLGKAEEDLAGLKNGPDALEVESKKKQAAVAQASLAKAEEELAELRASADPLDIALKEASVVAARVALDTALQRLAGVTIKATRSGIVSQVSVEPGQEVGINTPIVEIVDDSVIELDGAVDEIDVLFVREGARAQVSMDALPGQALQGSVSYIATAATTQQGVVSYPIKIRLTAPDGVQLREGLSAIASVVINQEDGLLVPNQSLYGSFEQPVVRVMNNGRIEERAVVLGSSDDFWTVVRDGLSEGEQVVMESQQATTSQFGPGGGFRQLQGTFGGVPGGGPQTFIAPGGGGGGQRGQGRGGAQRQQQSGR